MWPLSYHQDYSLLTENKIKFLIPSVTNCKHETAILTHYFFGKVSAETN